ncbi:MAG TPA: Gfo/Idh/MocA family oxidoreductase [Bacteroidota bacterium]|nr:Gfo/Idh/MocA family oxidoreductase [Bacteroidota bacterium]
MDKAKIGIVGLGWIAQVFHLPILTKIPDAIVSCVCDKDRSRARTLAEKYGIKRYYSDINEMLAKEELDAVDICVTTNAHKEISLICLDAKKDIFVEKPIARKYLEAVAIAEAAKKAKKKVMVGMNNRFRPDTMILRSFIENNDLGKVFYVKAGWLKKLTDQNAWMGHKDKSGGGVFLDLGIVMLDLALWMTGYPEVLRVNASNYSHATPGVEDSAAVFLFMKNGATITIEVSWSFYIENELFYCNIYGDKGSAKLNPLKIHREMHGNIVNVTPGKIDDPQNLFRRSYENELKHFIGTVRGMHPVISTADEAVLRMRIVDAIYQSAAKGKEIRFK